MRQTCIAILLVVLATFWAANGHELEGFGDSQDEPVQHAINKLEMYALGASSKTLLTIEDLREAYRTMMSWGEKGIIFMKRKLPIFRLFVNFAMVPLELHGLNEPDDANHDSFEIQFIQRLHSAYREFRSSYLGKMVGEMRFPSSPKMDLLINSLVDGNNAQPLTKKMIANAKIEFEAISGRVSEIETVEDIYSNLNEYEGFMNSLNRPTVRVLVKDVFPNVDQLDSPGGVEDMKKRYARQLLKKNMAPYQGTVGSFGPVDKYF